jgi:hypothetical protein
MIRGVKRKSPSKDRRTKGRLINLGKDKLYFVPDDSGYAKEIDAVLHPKKLKTFLIQRDELICLTEEELEALLSEGTSLRPARK